MFNIFFLHKRTICLYIKAECRKLQWILLKMLDSFFSSIQWKYWKYVIFADFWPEINYLAGTNWDQILNLLPPWKHMISELTFKDKEKINLDKGINTEKMLSKIRKILQEVWQSEIRLTQDNRIEMPNGYMLGITVERTMPPHIPLTNEPLKKIKVVRLKCHTIEHKALNLKWMKILPKSLFMPHCRYLT